jgi:hypothetical protein
MCFGVLGCFNEDVSHPKSDDEVQNFLRKCEDAEDYFYVLKILTAAAGVVLGGLSPFGYLSQTLLGILVAVTAAVGGIFEYFSNKARSGADRAEKERSSRQNEVGQTKAVRKALVEEQSRVLDSYNIVRTLIGLRPFPEEPDQQEEMDLDVILKSQVGQFICWVKEFDSLKTEALHHRPDLSKTKFERDTMLHRNKPE